MIFKAAPTTSRILTVGVVAILAIGAATMTVITPVGMNPNGQFVISQPGDTFVNVAAVVNTDSYTDLINLPAIPNITRTTSALSLALVGNGATGTQISATKDSTIRCTVSTSTTANITTGAAATSLVVLKICSTNNATEASWTTVATLESDQTIGLALALNSVQVVKGQLCSDIPIAWFVKLVNSGTGTHAETSISGQQTIYG